jgi:glycerol-3-phosphate cytidylyltransferase
MKTIYTWEEAAQLAQECKNRGGIVVTTNGCFDLLHKGHVEYLSAARQLGDLLIVGINSDASVKKVKGPSRPLNDETARAVVLGALKCVDAVCIFKEATPVEWLRVVQPNIHVKGGDWDPAKMPESPVLKEWGGTVKVLPYVEGFSTTGLIEKSKSIR